MNPLGDLISQGYTFAQSIVALCVFFMLVYAGIQMMLGEKKKALQIFKDVAYGTILLFSAYAILNTINKDLVTQKGDAGLPQRTTSQ